MARFIQAEYPTEHAGIARVTRGATALRATARSFQGTRGAAALLLAALVSAMVVVANELITTWTDGRLLAAWVATWLVGFAALALLAAPIRAAAAKARSGLASWNAARLQRAEDYKLWDLALTDARIMADLSRAMSREAARDVRGYY